jgi:hypothetical protein
MLQYQCLDLFKLFPKGLFLLHSGGGFSVCSFAVVRRLARYTPLSGKETATKTSLRLKSNKVSMSSLMNVLMLPNGGSLNEFAGVNTRCVRSHGWPA